MCLLLYAAAGLTAERQPSSDPYLGTWVGTWEMPGAGSGGFELTLEKDPEGALIGRVSVTGDPAYKATMRTVTIDGSKLTARYDFPPDDRAEVQLTATFHGDSANGSWSLREKGGSEGEVASGTWTVKKKTSV